MTNMRYEYLNWEFCTNTIFWPKWKWNKDRWKKYLLLWKNHSFTLWFNMSNYQSWPVYINFIFCYITMYRLHNYVGLFKCSCIMSDRGSKTDPRNWGVPPAGAPLPQYRSIIDDHHLAKRPPSSLFLQQKTFSGLHPSSADGCSFVVIPTKLLPLLKVPVNKVKRKSNWNGLHYKHCIAGNGHH